MPSFGTAAFFLYDLMMDNASVFYRILTSISVLPTNQRSMSNTFWRLCELLAQQDKEDGENAGSDTYDHSNDDLAIDMAKILDGSTGSGHNFDLEASELSHLSAQEAAPIHFDDPCASIVNFKPSESLKITCLTIGSRGDVQPYIALCKALLVEGHQPKIATHREFESWVRQHGIDFAPVEGDPAELMRICVENGMFTYSFLKEASLKFRGWIDDLLSSAWTSCQGSDILIESPSAMAGIHIAEALRIPYFRAFTMPWTRTRAYPHAFAVPDHKMGGAYNYMTYVMFDNVFWKAIAGQVNRWRKRQLGLRGTNLDKMQPNKVPFLYNFSPSVVPPPTDYGDWIRVTGYWFLDEGSSWSPPQQLLDFIQKARNDRKKIVYIGFGSIVVSDPTALTKTVIESVLKTDVRCILSKGWSDRLGDPASAKAEVPLPPEIHQITAAPHDWLFTQVDAVAHHGGAGTTGASLRAGVPTIVKPFFGDQFFFGSRVEDLGVGISLKKLNVNIFSRALWEATNSERMIVKAKLLGEKIRKENGVEKAIQALYRDLEYAKTLVRRRSMAAASPSAPAPLGESRTGKQDWEEDLAGIEETWTLVGHPDTDMELSHSSHGHESEFDLRASAAVAAGTLPDIAIDEDDGEEDVTR
ncbi:Sterol 3-beta-glucosyltransferase [Emydomyces testavorans]|uniref:sterol 3beta-glucosyltransferase n=1 Tax=Emydomyces testavorans TaxID=2070801 RepID=A0AAF0DLK3_9EURO|nr:Sterol 3-beta-glucosyltransferase [Emydomyces testavorans]